MSQEQLQQIQELIQQGRFAEARAILASIDHPQASSLLAMIDQMEQTAAAAVQASEQVPEPPPAPPAEEESSDLLNRLREEQAQEAPPAASPPAPSRRAADGSRVSTVGTYEMLWDCQYCGADKLLGKTHRFCPNCGAAQNPDARYYPSEDEQVAVADHEYVGADVTCPACDTLNAGSAEFCGNCGSPLTAGARAKTLGEQRAEAGGFVSSGSRDLGQERFDAEMERVGVKKRDDGKKGGSRWIIGGILVLVLLCIGVIAAVAFVTSDAQVYVTGHEWERNIIVEQYGPHNVSAWCDNLPAGAYSVTRQREQRSTNRIPDGEECENVRVDQGDGTFRTEQRCRTKYREEPVYDDKCYFIVDRWTQSRTVTAAGDDLKDDLIWPNPDLNCAGQARHGCEREANRNATYTLHLHSSDNDKDYSCPVELDRWQAARIENAFTLEVGSILGDARCNTLAEVR